MNLLSTNKQKNKIQQGHKLSQPDLHVKILNLIANRMNPVNATLALEKQICGSCVNRLSSPTAHSTKKNSLATTRAKQAKSKVNQTMCEGYGSHNERRITEHTNSQTNFRQPFDLHNKSKPQLKLTSKVLSLSIDHTKMGNFTIDLRPQIPTEFVNIKMMSKLKLENAQKERRIAQLESEVLDLHERLIELSLNVQERGRAFSEISFPASADINKISEIINGNNDSKQTQIWIDIEQDNPQTGSEKIVRKQPKEDERYEALLRMLKVQAVELQQLQGYSSKDKEMPSHNVRTRAYSKPY